MEAVKNKRDNPSMEGRIGGRASEVSSFLKILALRSFASSYPEQIPSLQAAGIGICHFPRQSEDRDLEGSPFFPGFAKASHGLHCEVPFISGWAICFAIPFFFFFFDSFLQRRSDDIDY
jgi:hypothetical protein